MPAPLVLVSTVVSSGPVTELEVPVPTGTQDNDVLFLVVQKDDDAGVIGATVDGFSEVGDNDHYTYFRRAARDEPASYTIELPEARQVEGIMLALRGPVESLPTFAFQATSGVNTPVIPGLSLGEGDYFLVASIETNRGDISITPPVGYTVQAFEDNGDPSTAGSAALVATRFYEGGSIADQVFTLDAVTDARVAHFAFGFTVAWDIYPAADPNGALLATITTATKRMIRIEEDGPGYGSFTVNRHDAIATAANLAKGNVVKVRIPELGDDYIFAFIIEEGDFTILSSDEEGDEDLTFGGRGVLAILDRARMWSEAFSTGLDVNDTWTEIWRKSITNPVGSAVVGGDATYLYVINATDRRIRKIRQSDRAVVRTSPALWSGSDNYAAGLGADPADSTILWVLEAPWSLGGAGNTKIRKVRISDWAILDTFNLGSAVQLTAIKASSTHLWVSKYDGPDIQKRSKTDGSVVDSYSISYNGNAQTNATGISVNGTSLAYWFQGTKRALIASTGAPTTITDVIKTTGLSAFGGDWSTEGLNDYFYPVSYTADVVWKYQVTSATPRDPVDGEWRLDEGTPGAILARLMAEWQHASRPQEPLPMVTYGFDFTNDTDANAWASHPGTAEFSARVGDLGLETVLRLIPFGLTIQMSPYFELKAYNEAAFGTDRTAATFATGKVRVEAAVNAAEGLRRRMDDRRVDSHMLVGGEGGLFATATDDDLGYVREGFLSTSLTDEGAMEGSGDAELARQRRDSDAQAAVIPWGNDEAAGLYLPGPSGSNGHYWVGDTIRVHTGDSDFDLDEQDRQVKAITIEELSNSEWRSLVDLAAVFVPIYDPVQPAGAASVGGSGTAGATTVTTKAVVTVKDTENGESYSGSIVESADWGVHQAGTGRVGVTLRTRSLNDLVEGDPTDGQVPIYDADLDVWVPGTPAGSLPWFNVKDYGAAGDGSTDDTSAFTDWHDAIEAAGGGVAYVPRGRYKTSGGFVFTVPVLLLGDGSVSHQADEYLSEILCTSQTAVLFTFTNDVGRIASVALTNTYAGTPSAGAGIQVSGGSIAQRVDFEDIVVTGFYINVDVQVGAVWSMRACHMIGPVLYGLKVRNTVNPDAGDWSITDTTFSCRAFNPTAAIRIESSGGGKISNCKVNQNSLADVSTYGTKQYVSGIDLSIGTGSSSVILLIANSSIENVSGDAILAATTGSGFYHHITVIGCQFGLYSNNTGRVFKGSGANLQYIVLDDLICRTSGTARAAIELTNVEHAKIGMLHLAGFNAALTTSGTTDVVDDTGSIAAGVAITGTPSSGQVPIASSGTAAAWGTPSTSPTGAAGGDLAGTYPNPSVDAINGSPLGTISPADGDSLRWNGSAWVGANGLVVIQAPTATIDAGPPFEVTIVSDWGIDSSGNPYYDDAGVVAGEEAALCWDPLTEQYALVSCVPA